MRSRRGAVALRRSKATRRSTLTPPARVPSRSKSTWRRAGFSGPEAAADRRPFHTRPEADALPPTRSWRRTERWPRSSATSPSRSSPPREQRAERRSRSRRARAPDAAKEAVTFARERIFRARGRSRRAAIMRDALRRGMGEATYSEVRAEFEARAEAGELPLACRPTSTTPAGSSPRRETIAAERAKSAMFWTDRTPSRRS